MRMVLSSYQLNEMGLELEEAKGLKHALSLSTIKS